MDFDRMNRWLTLAANLGVLVGIFFLAYELNLSRTAAIAEIYQGRAHSRSEADLQKALSSPNFVAADIKFQSLLKTHGVKYAVAQLTEEERYLIRLWHSSLLVRFDNVAFQYSIGLIPDQYFEDTVIGMQRFMPVWDELDLVLLSASREVYENAIADAKRNDE
jgi:hypothetical protein